ncbi:MAG: hypothetical protein IT290_05925 [Deltaproteobacteria bacterium]|nr:hypothetical protein [Deltaproteobacteria bacterium]
MNQTIGHLNVCSAPPTSNPGALPFRLRRKGSQLVHTIALEVVILVGSQSVRTAWIGVLPGTEMAGQIKALKEPRVHVRGGSRIEAMNLDIEEIRELAEQEIHKQASTSAT